MTTLDKTLQSTVEAAKKEEEDSPSPEELPIVNLIDSSSAPVVESREGNEDLSSKIKENSAQSICLKLKPEQSYKKETKASRLGKSTGRWTSKEHVLFIEGLKIYGKNWKKVESFIGTRTGTQIRSHAQKFFNRIRKEFSTEDPSKYVIDNMGDENIRKIILEDCGDDISNLNEEKELSEDTPELLFSITKDKIVKKKKNDQEDSPKSLGATGSAFKSFKRQGEELPKDKEDSKTRSKSVVQNISLSNKQVAPPQIQNPIINPLAGLLGGLNGSIPPQMAQPAYDPTSLLLQTLLSGNLSNQLNVLPSQNLNNTVLSLMMTLLQKQNITN